MTTAKDLFGPPTEAPEPAAPVEVQPDPDGYYYLFGDIPEKDKIGGVLAIDTETTGLKWTDDLLGISVAWRDLKTNQIESCYLSKVPGLLSDAVWSKKKLWTFLAHIFEERASVGHYVSFDARVLYRELSLVMQRTYDTWHMAKSTAFYPSNSLEYLTVHVAGIKDDEWSKLKENRKNLKAQSPYHNSVYARKDAVYTLQVFEALYPAYQKTPHEVEDLKFANLTYEIMGRGFPLNEEIIEARYHREEAKLMELQTELARGGLYNVSSPSQIMRALKSRGLRVKSTSQEDLASYADDPFVEAIIEAGQLVSNVYARLQTFRDYSRSGHLHAEWHPFGTASYRMSCKDPNLMAQPLKNREGRYYDPLAEVFVPDRGYVLQFDISQAEVRLATMNAKANSLAVFLNSGEDAYMQMARQAYHSETKESRQMAKRATLASIYEEGPKAFSEKHGVTYDDAFTILDDFRRAFPEIKRMSNSYMHYAQKHGYINLFSGRRIYFSKDDQRLYRAFNQEVQGGIAELMRSFMLKVEHRLPGHLIGQIHDSVVLYFPDVTLVDRPFIEEQKHLATLDIQACLPEKVYALTNPRVPLKLDAEPFVKKIDDEY